MLSNSTLIDTQISGNRAYQRDTRKNMVNYRPTSIGLPAYMDEFCEARFECILPQNNIGVSGNGYQAMGGPVDRGIWVTTYQGTVEPHEHARVAHLARRRRSPVGAAHREGRRRQHGDVQLRQHLHPWGRHHERLPGAADRLEPGCVHAGHADQYQITDASGFDVRNNYFGTFVQDTWRINRNLTLNLGLRFEYENGIKEARDRALLWFDPEAEVSVASIAEAAYAANPIPGMPVSQFNIQGGTVYAGADGYDSRSWKPEALWMPRFSFGYRLGDKMVLKGGYGMYFDTLNARDWTPNLQGFNVTTTNPLSQDFGRTFLLGNPRAGVLPIADPFPVRAVTGSRYENVLGNALGVDTMLGRAFTAENPDRKHARVQRWRLSWQREIASRTALEVAYSGWYADRQSVSIRQDYLRRSGAARTSGTPRRTSFSP